MTWKSYSTLVLSGVAVYKYYSFKQNLSIWKAEASSSFFCEIAFCSTYIPVWKISCKIEDDVLNNKIVENENLYICFLIVA